MGVPIRLGQVVQTVHRVHGIGGVYQPLAVVPQLSVNLPAQAGVVPLGTTTVPFSVTVSNEQQDNADGTLHLNLPSGWTADPAEVPFHLTAQNSEEIRFTLHPGELTGQDYPIGAVAQSGNDRFTEGFTTVGYPGLRPYYLYNPATYRLRGVDLKLPRDLKVGYIMGTGDDVPEALAEIGVQPHLLSRPRNWPRATYPPMTPSSSAFALIPLVPTSPRPRRGYWNTCTTAGTCWSSTRASSSLLRTR